LKRGIFTLEDVENCVRLFNSENANDIAPLSALLTQVKGILEAKCDMEKRIEFRTLLARYVSLFGFIRALFRLRFKDKILIDFHIFASLLFKKLDPTMSAEDLEAEIAKVKLKTFDIEKIAEGVHEDGGHDDNNKGSNGGGGQNGGNVTNVRPMATVEEVVIAINLRFKERVSPEGVAVVENYLQTLKKVEDKQVANLRATIKNNLVQDERQVYDLVIKGIMDKLYTDYIINHSPQNYTELTQENVQGFINQSAYKLIREELRTAA